ncbi:sulfurtransferase TusA family protein [Silvimonas sp. JCM 19000]
MNADLAIDLSGLNCPLPILRTKKALAGLQSGQSVHVTCTDPATVKDFADFCKLTQNPLLASDTVDGKFVFVIQKR